MLKLFPSEFLYESRVSEEDKKKIRQNYFFKIKENKQTNISINNSNVKSDFRHSTIDYSDYTKIIGKYIQSFLREYLDGNCPPLNIFSFSNLYDGESSYMDSHRHPGSDLSMIYFLADDGDKTVFHPSNFKIQELSQKVKGFNEWSNVYSILPEEGKYVIFSSNLSHGVCPSPKNKERITISSNINIFHTP